MRAFIAAQIPAKIKDKAERVQKRLRRAGLRASWTKRDQMHLTLAFFPNLPPDQAEKAGKILETQLNNLPSIKLKLTPVNAFPNLAFPKVLWLGLAGETEKLKAAVLAIRKDLAQEKIIFDPKPFVAHLTLGRLRPLPPRKRRQVNQILTRFKNKARPAFEINQIKLVKSKLTPQGPVYTPLKQISLA